MRAHTALLILIFFGLLLFLKYLNPGSWHRNHIKIENNSQKKQHSTFEYYFYNTEKWEEDIIDSQIPLVVYTDPGQMHLFSNEFPLPSYPDGCNIFQPLQTSKSNKIIDKNHLSRSYHLKKKSGIYTILIYQKPTKILQQVNWRTISKVLCPYPPEAHIIFESLWKRYVAERFVELAWPRGYAPCWLFENTNEEGNGISDEMGECGNSFSYKLTYDWKYFREADMILFEDIQDLGKPDDYPWINQTLLPPRLPNQVWLLHSIQGPSDLPFIGMPSFRYRFDLTMGFPEPAHDIFEPMYSVEEEEIKKIQEIQPIYEKGDEITWLSTEEDMKMGACSHMAHWVGKLMKAGLNIIGYGPCADEIGLIKRNNDNNDITKLTLVIEDQRCLDRVSSKVYKVLELGSIPLYIGAQNIDEFVPSNSIINIVREFTTPKMAAERIIQLMQSDEILAKYHAWRHNDNAVKFCLRCIKSKKSVICRMLDRAIVS